MTTSAAMSPFGIRLSSSIEDKLQVETLRAVETPVWPSSKGVSRGKYPDRLGTERPNSDNKIPTEVPAGGGV